VETHLREGRVHLAQHDRAGGESAMAAAIDLDGRCEPAQVPVAVRPRDHERGLAQVVLGRDCAQLLIGQPFVKRTDRGGIALEGRGRK